MNPDTVAPPGAIQTLVRGLASHPDAAIAGARLLSERGFPELSWGVPITPWNELKTMIFSRLYLRKIRRIVRKMDKLSRQAREVDVGQRRVHGDPPPGSRSGRPARRALLHVQRGRRSLPRHAETRTHGVSTSPALKCCTIAASRRRAIPRWSGCGSKATSRITRSICRCGRRCCASTSKSRARSDSDADCHRRPQAPRLRHRHVHSQHPDRAVAARSGHRIRRAVPARRCRRRAMCWARTSAWCRRRRRRIRSPSNSSIPLSLARERVRLVHEPHYVLPPLIRCRSVVTIHDCIHLMFPQYLPSKLAYVYAKGSMWTATRKANRILTVSEASKRDILRFFDVRAGESRRHSQRDRRALPVAGRSRADGSGAPALSARSPVRAVCRQHQAAQEHRAADRRVRPRPRASARTT